MKTAPCFLCRCEGGVYLLGSVCRGPGVGVGGRRARSNGLCLSGALRSVYGAISVMNVSGHRIGTAEVESALTMHAAVAESACVQVPHDVKGNSIFAFVILRPGFAMDSNLQGELKAIVRQQVCTTHKGDTACGHVACSACLKSWVGLEAHLLTEAYHGPHLHPSFCRMQVGPFAQPDTILEAPGLPKTRSGKIMRRILRKVCATCWR